MSEFDITVKVEKYSGVLRPFCQEIGITETPDGKEIRVLSMIPTHNFIIAFDGIDYVITSQDIVNAVMNKIINTKGESDG